MSDDGIVLNFHDSLLRQSDMKLLDPNEWLNDNIISFAFEYFEKEQFAKFSKFVAFVSPQVTQCMKLMSAEEAQLLVEPLALKDKQYVFFAVNDNMSLDETGGHHWSLLLLNVTKRVCYHYDSVLSSNHDSAQLVYKVLKPMFNGDLKFEEGESPQQKNSSDCGVYVICLTEHLCDEKMKETTDSLSSSSSLSAAEAVTAKTVCKKREHLKSTILYLRHKQSTTV